MNEPAARKLPKVEVINLHSKLLDKEICYSAIVPNAGGNSNERPGVLYLLHGLFGGHENWTNNTSILEYAVGKNFIIVCPDAGDGWYTDNPSIPNHSYESFFFEEIIPDSEARFNAGGGRVRRAVAGISMGGYGAFKFALRRPEMFCFAASMSGAYHAAEIVSGGNEKRAEVLPSIEHVFGEDKVLRAQNSLTNIIAQLPNEIIHNLPFFYFDCGEYDEFFTVNVKFAELLRQRGIANRFEKRSGGHGWEYWDANLGNIIDLAAIHLD